MAKMESNNAGPVRLVLSGGGTRGFAHLGMVSALLEMGFTLSAISGSSAGAVAGAFLCSGYHPEEVLSIFLNQKPFDLAAASFNSGLLSTRNLEKLFSKLLPEGFEDLQLPLAVVATDLISGQWLTFKEGKLIPVLAGSCAVPGLFRPVHHDQFMLVDGGVLNNLPVEAIPIAPGKIAGLHVNPVTRVSAPASSFRILERAFHLGVYSNTIHRMAMTDCFIEPPGLAKFRVFDFASIEKVYQEGYEYVKSQQDRINSELKL